ncbi:uracil phosphoribosyltransferase [Lentisalinibacter sediminis]|uniref:uracil phosphoribosyltransferase n=1 Tax=Lentisalinibacter sediminis TaxID=2992237 RepID=UPI00386778A2
MYVEVDHPCIQHKLALIRNKDTGHKKFRELTNEITMFLCYEALKQVQVEEVEVETPVAPATCKRIANEIVVVPVLRAGVGMLEGILDLVPIAKVGFVGMQRDEETATPVEYYQKLPTFHKDALYIVVDPMLATGGSTIATLDLLKAGGVEKIIVICMVTCPEGIAAVEKTHPDVQIYTAAVDDHLNEKKYIVPGLGDAGDRLYGTI